ncbi:MAG: hypothetical protein VR64_12570 [Desulfatitalea sp. BRH_c12]|nr:MAG: hypothetical protein VR64_12570 [Desulfatitalea sp. BRH_c12]
MQWLQSDAFRSAGCDVLCVMTFGQDPGAWVSLTIGPIHQEPDPVEIMSMIFSITAKKVGLLSMIGRVL